MQYRSTWIFVLVGFGIFGSCICFYTAIPNIISNLSAKTNRISLSLSLSCVPERRQSHKIKVLISLTRKNLPDYRQRLQAEVHTSSNSKGMVLNHPLSHPLYCNTNASEIILGQANIEGDAETVVLALYRSRQVYFYLSINLTQYYLLQFDHRMNALEIFYSDYSCNVHYTILSFCTIWLLGA